MTVTSQGDTMMSLLVPMATLSCQIVLATVRGLALQLSRSKSTPSNLQVVSISAKLEMNAAIVFAVENTNPQLPFCPPTEINTFFPLLCHELTKLKGKVALSTLTVPLDWGLPKAKMTNLTLGLTSSVVDWPQQSMLNPQQNMDTGVAVFASAMRTKRAMMSFIQITSEWLQIKQDQISGKQLNKLQLYLNCQDERYLLRLKIKLHKHQKWLGHLMYPSDYPTS